MPRSSNSSRRQSQSGLASPLTREEFEALPLAIQRKVRSVSVRPVTFAHCSYSSPRNSRFPNWPDAELH
jgi:hypothetical protein